MTWEVFNPWTAAVLYRLPGWVPSWLVNLTAPRWADYEAVAGVILITFNDEQGMPRAWGLADTHRAAERIARAELTKYAGSHATAAEVVSMVVTELPGKVGEWSRGHEEAGS